MPDSFNNTFSGNGKVYPNQTFAMWRAVVGDVLRRSISRYGAGEVEAWHLETWNEPDQGWGWAKVQHADDPVLASYVTYWDATAAGVEDAEAATGARLYLGGTASGRAAGDAYFLPAMLNHKAGGGRNSLTGAPVRWDYLSAHVKGESTSYVTVQGEWAVSALLRSQPAWADPAAGLLALPISNDEGDPMVGWEKPEDWRADARYAAILPKMVAQHLAAIADNATGGSNNPLGWLSFDGAFMNGVDDTYTGFGMRTMTARFGQPDASGASPFAFVRKGGLAALALLARLPTARRCAATAAGSTSVLLDNFGALASSSGEEAGVLVYNSADCSEAHAPGVAPSIAIAGLPFDAARVAKGGGVAMGVGWWVDDAVARSPFATWVAQGSPPTPTPAQLKDLWRAAAASGAPATPPTPLPLLPCTGSGGSGFCVALPAINVSGSGAPPGVLPLPGIMMWHLALQPEGGAPPPAPAAPVAYIKPPSASFLDGAVEREVLLRWDCSAAPRALAAYVVQVNAAGSGQPAAWATANAPPFPADLLCTFVHAAPAAAAAQPLQYRVAAVDYWGQQGPWSATATAGPWPALD